MRKLSSGLAAPPPRAAARTHWRIPRCARRAMLTRGLMLPAEDAVMEPTVLENLRVCLRAKKLQPAEVVGALSENYHGYAQVRARARRRARCIRSLEPSLLTRTRMCLCMLAPDWVLARGCAAHVRHVLARALCRWQT